MAIPGYVVPGQLICPLIEKGEGGIIRHFQPGRGSITDKTDDGITAIYATVIGKVNVFSLDGKGNNKDDEMEVDVEDDQDDAERKTKPVALKFKIDVDNQLRNTYTKSSRTGESNRSSNSSLPEIGDIVLARVTRISITQANTEILAVENQGNAIPDDGAGIHAVGETGGSVFHASGSTASRATSSDIGEGFGGIIRSQDIRATERDKVKLQESFKPGDIIRAKVISLGDGTNYYLSTAENSLGVLFAKSKDEAQMIPVDWKTMRCTLTDNIEKRKCAKPF